MRKYILLLILLVPAAASLKGQIIDTKNSLSLTVGKLVYGDQDNLFFPGGISNSGLSFRADYLHTYLPWMKIGLEGSFLLPGLPQQASNEVAKVSGENEKLLTAGLNATFLLPYKELGWRNHLRLQIGVAPVIVNYQGTRNVIIQNTIYLVGDDQPQYAGIDLKGPATRLGLSITPSMEYYLSQRTGIKVSVNSLFTSLRSDRSIQNTLFHSLDLGVFFALSRNKRLNY